MDIRVVPTELEGVVIVEPAVISDARGFFMESYNRRRFEQAGIAGEFVQDNHSRSACGVLRGIHFQDMTAPMAKLVRCTAGRILDVVVDLRAGAPTCGRWTAVELNADNMKQAYVPVGFGHAFLALTDAEVQYKCTAYYAPSAEGCLAWNDPDMGIEWPTRTPVLSGRDARGLSLREYLAHPAFRRER